MGFGGRKDRHVVQKWVLELLQKIRWVSELLLKTGMVGNGY